MTRQEKIARLEELKEYVLTFKPQDEKTYNMKKNEEKPKVLVLRKSYLGKQLNVA